MKCDKKWTESFIPVKSLTFYMIKQTLKYIFDVSVSAEFVQFLRQRKNC